MSNSHAASNSEWPTFVYPWTPSGSSLYQAETRLRESRVDRFGTGRPKLIAVGDGTDFTRLSHKRLEQLDFIPLDDREAIGRVFIELPDRSIHLAREYKLNKKFPSSFRLVLPIPAEWKLLIGLSNDADYTVRCDVVCYDPFFQEKGDRNLGIGRQVILNPKLLPKPQPTIGKQNRTPTIRLTASPAKFKADTPPPSLYPIKILLRKVVPGGVEFYLAGDRPPELIKSYPDGTTVLGAYLYNSGSQSDDWVASFQIYQDPPLVPARQPKLEYVTSAGTTTFSVEAVYDLFYIGTGVWTSEKRPTEGLQEAIYSGISSTDPLTVQNSGSLNGNTVEQLPRTEVVTDYNQPSPVDPTPGNPSDFSYRNRVTTFFINKVLTRNGTDYTRTTTGESINVYATPSGIFGNKGVDNRILDRLNYSQTCGTIGGAPATVEFTDPFASPIELFPYTETTYPLGDLCTPEDTFPTFVDNTTTGNYSALIQVAPNLKVLDFQDEIIYTKTGEPNRLVRNERFIYPFICGTNSCVYGAAEQVVDSPNLLEPSVLIDKTYYNDGTEVFLRSGRINPYSPANGTLKGQTFYKVNIEDFTASGDFQMSVTSTTVSQAPIATELFPVLDLGDPAEVQIASASYFPQD